MDGGQAKPANLRPVVKPPQGFSASALERRLSLRKRARQDAARNLPRHDGDELSAAELAVLEVVGAERARLDQARHEARVDAERRLRTLAPAPQDFSGPVLDARLGLKQAAGGLANEWSEAAARAAEGRDELDAFKRANHLHRQAVYPRSTLLQSGLLFCAALFETAASSVLLAADGADRLLGGALIAFGIAGANITLGFFAGYLGLRYLQHVRLHIKAASALAFGSFTAPALVLHLLVANWRDGRAQATGQDIAFADAGSAFWSLLQASSPQAVVLLLLGAGVWAFAALQGYSGFDDPYPD